jgi:hypothetical protein
MKSIHRTFFTILSLGFICAAPAADPLVRHDVYEMRLSQKESQPDVAEYMASRNREALAYVRINVGADGRVTQAEVVDGFYSAEQAAGAQKIAGKLKYLPKTVDGKPVETSGLIPIRYLLPPGTDSHSADASLQLVADLLTARKWSEALEKMDQIQNEVTRNWDYRVLESLRATAYAGLGNAEEGLRHAIRGCHCSFTSATDTQPTCEGPSFLVKQTVALRMRLQRQLGLYGEALESWGDLKRLESADELRPFEKEVAQLRLLASGDDAIPTWLQLTESGDAGTLLFRNTVAFDQVTDGEIEWAAIECPAADGQRRHLDSYALPLASAAQAVPAGAKHCSIHIKGKPGTRVRVVQSGTAMP